MPATDGDLKRMDRDLVAASKVLRGCGSVLVVSHIDADGISAGAIASITADRLGLERETVFVTKITEETIGMVNGSTADAVWICDLGSGYLSEFNRSSIIITDHHVPDPSWRRKQTTLESFSDIRNLNPHSYGMDGSYEICGAGMTYLLSKTVDPGNIDLAWLAIVGAVGDFQDSSDSRLVSLNRSILKDAEINGDVRIDEDLRLFGRETRPIQQILQFSSDPQIPGLSDNPRACSELIDRLGIPVSYGGVPRVWNDMDEDEKGRVIDAVLELLSPEDAKRIHGEMYTFLKQPPGTGLRDSKEFATILNSCGRYDDAATGMRICYGDTTALADADRNRAEHRKNISAAMNYVRNNHLVRERRFVQYFDAGSEIRETVVGIVAGMMLNTPECRSNLPILAFVNADDGVKVSARANRFLVDRGLDLSKIMKTAAELVGGFGGGHSVAAGATIPYGNTERFIEIVEDLVSAQLVRSQEPHNIARVLDHGDVRIYRVPVVLRAVARKDSDERCSRPMGGHPIRLIIADVQYLARLHTEQPGEFDHRHRRGLRIVVIGMVPPHDCIESPIEAVSAEGGLRVQLGTPGEQSRLHASGMYDAYAFGTAGERFGFMDEFELDRCEDLIDLCVYRGPFISTAVGFQPAPYRMSGSLRRTAEVDLLPRDAVTLEHVEIGMLQSPIIHMGPEERAIEVEPHRFDRARHGIR